MSGIERPYRAAFDHFNSYLLEKDKQPRPSATPSHLPLTDIEVHEVLFQQRETSLLYRASQSQRHIEIMAQVVREGGELDPIVIAAFGPAWVLLDGHHRRAAYLEAGYERPVPVEVRESDLSGERRIAWAIGLSTSLNSKNKLSMSDADKLDAAWRLTVVNVLSKREVHETTRASKGVVGNMRRVRARLQELGRHTDSQLYAMTWKQASWELRKAEGSDTDMSNPEAHERKLRNLIKKLSPALEGNFTATELLEALEELRPGIGREFTEIATQEAASLEI